MRCALRKARRKRTLCVRARLSSIHLERMTAHDRTLKASRKKSTALATVPVCRTRSTISPPTNDNKREDTCISVNRTPV